MATQLYHATIAFGRDSDIALARECWDATPWMVNIFTGGFDGQRYEKIRRWCRQHFGNERFWLEPQRGGTWRCGSATCFGWTWYGFATEDQMAAFIAAWPTPINALDEMATND